MDIINDRQIYKYDKAAQPLSHDLPAGICTFIPDRDLTVIFCNDKFRELCGCGECGAEHNIENLFSVVLDKDYRRLHDEIAAHVRQGDREFQCETRLSRPGAGHVWVIISASLDGAGETVTAVWMDISLRKKTEEMLRISEEEYRMVASHSKKNVFRFDVKLRKAYLPKETIDLLGYFTSTEADVPNSVIKSGAVPPESQASYVNFFEDMAAGIPNGHVYIQFRVKDGSFRWFQMDYSLICDEDGAPWQGIVSFEDISERREREAAYQKWKQTYKSIDPKKMMYYEFNITTGICECEDGKLVPHIFPKNAPVMKISYLAKYSAEHYVYKDDAETYLRFFNIDRLIADYKSGKRSESIEFRYYAAGGAVRWARAAIDMLRYPYSNDIKCYLLIEDVHEGRIANISLLERSTKDPLTSVLNRRAFEEAVSQLLHGTPAGCGHIFMMLDIDGFKQVNDTMGHAVGDDVLIYTARSIEALLRPGDLVGRMGGDEFMLCLRGASDEEVAAARADLIGSMVKLYGDPRVKISASIGIALYPQDAQSFEEIYKRADRALYAAKHMGRARYAIYGAAMAEAPCAGEEPQTPAFSAYCSMAEHKRTEVLRRQITEENSRLNKTEREISGRCEALLENIGVALYEWRTGSGIVYFTKSIEKFAFFSAWKPASVFAPPGAEGFYAEDYKDFRLDIIRPLFEGKNCVQTVCRLKKCDGSFVRCSVMIRCRRNAEKEIVSAFCMIREYAADEISPGRYPELVLENMAAGAVIVDVGETFSCVYASPSYYKLTGTGTDRDIRGPLDVGFTKVFPEYKSGIKSALLEAAKNGSSEFLYRVMLDRGIGWRCMKASAIASEGGHTLCAVNIIDVTKLQTYEIYTMALAKAMHGAVMIYESGLPLYPLALNDWIKKQAAVMDDNCDNFKEENIYSLVPQEEIEKIKGILYNRETQDKQIDTVVKCRDFPGSPEKLLVRSIFMGLTADGRRRSLLLFVDLSARMKLSAELENIRAYLDFLMERLPTASFEAAWPVKSIHCSPAMQKLFAIKSAQIPADAEWLAERGIIAPESKGDVTRLLRAIQDGAANASAAIMMKRPAGGFAPVNVECSSLRSRENERSCIFGICTPAAGPVCNVKNLP